LAIAQLEGREFEQDLSPKLGLVRAVEFAQGRGS
jgi:hypothetical protein